MSRSLKSLSFVAGFVATFVLSCQMARPAYHVVVGGHTIKVAAFWGVDPDCHSNGKTQINVLRAPKGGHLEVEDGRDYPNFPTANARSRCNRQKVPSTRVMYQADVAFAGDDSFDIEIIFPSGVATRRRFFISVRMASAEDAIKAR